ncbi:MAG: hypothetical protein K2O32_11150 [Acetatifactor sp.]|nr:hypothetical protein [Acetatifactor sp.]
MGSLIVQIVSEEPTESGTLIEKTELSVVQEEQEKSETLMEENAWIEDTEDDVTAVCEMVRAVDFTVEEPHMELTEEEDRAYKEAFLRLLKNELPITGWNEGEDCYQNLWWAGIPYEELLEKRDSVGFPYSYYYDDIDGDGKPEFGVNQSAVYFFDYELGEEACSIFYCGLSRYFENLLGVGKIWEYDAQHSQVERNRYIVLNSDGKWETVVEWHMTYDLGSDGNWEPHFYNINGVKVGKEDWEELIAPFYEATEHKVPTKTLTEVFGELLEVE